MSVAVVGSINEDLVVRVARHPAPGETVLAEGHSTGPGGKGANQAVAAARLGAQVSMIGRVGADDAGSRMLENLHAAGVETSAVTLDPDRPSGLAVITVDAAGENSIAVSPGANGGVSSSDVRAHAGVLDLASVTLLQLEVPLDAVMAAATLAGHRLILNPAPARELPDELLAVVDVLIPNQHELALLAGVSPPRSIDEVIEAARSLRGPGAVVTTLGGRGAVLATATESLHLPAPEVDVVDTTGAGDAFCGALAASLSSGASLSDAVRWGVAAGSLATTKLGAQAALPSPDAVRRLVDEG